jgi:hypothetical protein
MRTGAPSRWPAHCRIYRVLREAKKPKTMTEVASLACVADQTAGRALKDLRALGLAHVADWQRSIGYPAALWAFGFGVDTPRPDAEPVRAVRLRHYHKKKAEVIEQFGMEVWKRMRVSRNNGGADVISTMDDGVIYRRRPVARAAA